MGGRKKPLLALHGEPLLQHALRPFLAHPAVTALRVALSPDDASDCPGWLRDLDPRLALVAGGTSRTASVRAALEALPDVDVVLVHDAARPLVTHAIIDRCISAVGKGTGAIAGWPASDTLKEVDKDRHVLATPDRSRLWHAQTPQAFPAELLRRAYAAWDGREVTDDGALVEMVGGTVVMVEGSATNLKVTRLEDLAFAEVLLDMYGPSQVVQGA